MRPLLILIASGFCTWPKVRLFDNGVVHLRVMQECRERTFSCCVKEEMEHQ